MEKIAQAIEKISESNRIDTLLRQQSQLERQVLEQQTLIASLQAQLRLLQLHRYGQRSERRTEDVQADLFNEAEELLDQDASQREAEEQTNTDTITYERRKRSARAPLPESLPRREIEHDLTEADKRCACGGEKRRIGSQTSERLAYIPAQLYVERHIRHHYACPCCEQGVQTATKPATLLPKSNASESLLAYLITAKYQDSLPLYRMSKIFARHGVELSRNTLARWVIQCSEAVTPLIERLEQHLRQSPVMLMDETTVQVNKEPGKAASSRSYMWIRRGLSPPGLEDPQGRDITLYHYSSTRSAQVALALLADYRGALMTDGYAGYLQAVQRYRLEHATCWAHARRKFVEAENALPQGKKAPAISAILALIRQLYTLERRWSEHTAEEKARLRPQQARPILDKLKAQLDKKSAHVTPKSKFGQAIAYTLNSWSTLSTYLENGHLPIDNNGAENGIRPFVIGRKNWLFADTVRGAQASARLYSLIETAKANGHEPYHYLRQLFEKLPLAKTELDYEALLPWRLSPQQTSD
jgi:transposase